ISWPALTTVQLPVTEMAEEMVRRVMRQEGDAPSAPGQCVFAGVTLVERESVAPPPHVAGSGGDHA
ncbi:MAG: LacI family DNA-binding transcriptional regulator, partial [Burkholderia sp.]|nr:LacI family DNA-binding transcriptional regulator [Burkholderia sp.]